MTVLPVIFEDETLLGFRPLAWSVPVAELRCGLLNARERVAMAAERPPALLLRTFLEPLARAHGLEVGVAPLRAAVAKGARLVLINGRVGSDWALLDRILGAAGAGQVWRDEQGLLACEAAGPAADALLESWSAWEADAAGAGCWQQPGRRPRAWSPPLVGSGPTQLVSSAWRRIWDLVPATAAAIAGDLARLGARLPARLVWGAVPDGSGQPAWTQAVDLTPWPDAARSSLLWRGDGALLTGDGCDLAPGVAIDTSAGPVVLGRGVRVMPHSFLEGPLFIGSGSVVKAGSAIYGQTSLGAVCKVGGEVGESTFLDFANKQHEGFIGHAYLGSWCNLGALTTCSDLKNTYGTIRVDLGLGPEDSGQRFIGVLMGEHAKTAIGTMLNTATTVGFASNVFGHGFPAKCLPCFTWGDGRTEVRQDPDRALGTAAVVMARRGCKLTDGHKRVFAFLGD